MGPNHEIWREIVYLSEEFLFLRAFHCYSSGEIIVGHVVDCELIGYFVMICGSDLRRVKSKSQDELFRRTSFVAVLA